MIELKDCIDSSLYQQNGRTLIKEITMDFLLGRISRENAKMKIYHVVEKLDGIDQNLSIAAKCLKMINGVNPTSLQLYIDNPKKYVSIKKKENKNENFK